MSSAEAGTLATVMANPRPSPAVARRKRRNFDITSPLFNIRLRRGLLDLQEAHQPHDIFRDSWMLPTLHRIVAVAHADHDLLDDPARPLAHHQDAVRQRHRLDEIV